MLNAAIRFADHIDGIFGEECLQLGMWGDSRTFVRFTRTQRCSVIAEAIDGGPSAVGEMHKLPVESDSIDAILLPREGRVMSRIRDFVTLGRAYFADDYAIEAKPLKKNVLKHPDLKTWLPLLSERFAALEVFDKETTEAASRELATELDIKPGILINGMRTVLTGQLAGPGMFDILIALGRDRVVRRLADITRLYEAE